MKLEFFWQKYGFGRWWNSLEGINSWGFMSKQIVVKLTYLTSFNPTFAISENSLPDPLHFFGSKSVFFVQEVHTYHTYPSPKTSRLASPSTMPAGTKRTPLPAGYDTNCTTVSSIIGAQVPSNRRRSGLGKLLGGFFCISRRRTGEVPYLAFFL